MQKTIYIVLAFACLIVLIAAQTNISGTTKIQNATINNAEIRGGLVKWVVVGAGDSNYNGEYLESGTWGGKPSYTNGACYLFWDVAQWYLSTSVMVPPPPAYYGTGDTLPATPWSIATGTPPPPGDVYRGD